MVDSFFRMKLDDNRKLVPFNKSDNTRMNLFLKALPVNRPINFYLVFEEGDEKTNQQLAKVHATIKEISDYTKQDFRDVKKTIKELCGLYRIVSTTPFEKQIKSFEECTKEELNTCIAKCDEILGLVYES
jgi:hypothetical protein